MSIRDRFENAVIDEAALDPDRREQHAQNANPSSHIDFFASRRPRKLSDAALRNVHGSEDEGMILAHTDVKATRQNVRRGAMLKDMVTQTLTERVQEPTGFQVLSMSFKDWTKMHQEYQDAEKVNRQKELPFVPCSVYMQNLLYRRDGTLRPKPIRPLLKGEVGQFLSGPHEGKIIVVTENSPEDDGKLRFQVPETITSNITEDPIDSILEIVQK